MPENAPPSTILESPFQASPEHALLAAMLGRAGLYHTTRAYSELLEFVNRLPQFAPFNALLLNIQKPGLRFAATEVDWRLKYKRTIKEGARPLVILWPFGPVAFVYDLEDTEGDSLPDAVAHTFRAHGWITSIAMAAFEERLWRKGINVYFIDYGDAHAGHIGPEGTEVAFQSMSRETRPVYRIRINAKHEPNVQFATLVHELGHLYLGHLGADVFLKIPDRSAISHDNQEIEAESLSYLVCKRANVHTKSESYLARYVKAGKPTNQIDVYALMRAAGHAETVLEIAVRSNVK